MHTLEPLKESQTPRGKFVPSIGEILLWFNGVENVVNRIEVLPSSRRDDALRMKVYRAVYEMQTLAAADVTPSVHIIVKDGWVTLEGVVDSEAERSQAYFRALTVTAQLYDHLRVAPEQP